MEAIQLHRWTREEYERIADADVFRPDTHVELIEGAIIEMSPQNRQHASTILLLQEALRSAFKTGYTVQPQLPIALNDISLPEPDLAVVPGSPRDYRSHPEEAILIVEVSESSLTFDRTTKLRLYARSGVPEYWIVNLVDYTVEVYRDPVGEVYETELVYEAADMVSPLARPEAAIHVADLLP